MPASLPLPALALGALLSWSSQANAQNKWFMVPGSLHFQASDLLVHEDMVLMAGDNGGGVLRVKQDGTGYQADRTTFAGSAVNSLASVGGTIYTAEYRGVRRSQDKGATWSPLVPINITDEVLDIAGNDSLLFAATEYGVWVSRDRGDTWTRCLKTESGGVIGGASLALQGSHVFVGWDKTWIKHSPDLGKTWEDLSFPGESSDWVLEILVLGNRLLVSGRSKLNISPDLGKTWLPTAGKDTLLNSNIFIFGFLSYTQGLVYAQRGDAPYRVTRVSADSGATWSEIDLGYGVEDVVVAGTNLFSAGYRDEKRGLYMTSRIPGAVRPVLPRRAHEAAMNRPVFYGSGMVIPWMEGSILDPRGRRLSSH